MLKNVKESAINDERLATVFFINNRLHGLYCFFKKAIAHSSLDGHSQLSHDGRRIARFPSSRKGAKSREEDLIAHVDIICYYSN